jgi:hypothetical protein
MGNAIDGIGVRFPGSLLHLSINPVPLPLYGIGNEGTYARGNAKERTYYEHSCIKNLDFTYGH